MAKLAGVPSQIETRAREILRDLEQNDNILGDALEENELLQETQARESITRNTRDTENTAEGVQAEGICQRDAEVETGLTKALLLLNPETITPRQALDVIYDLHAKAKSKGYK